MRSPLVVNVAELLRRPGTDKQLELATTAGEIALDDPRVAADAPVSLRLRMESLSNGIVVTGTVTVPWSDRCRRCLTPVSATAEADVDELYQSVRVSDEAFPIVGDQIDFTGMARELAALELPLAPLCRDDCEGICPTCGAVLADAPCDCTAEARDDRWSALDALRDQLDVN